MNNVGCAAIIFLGLGLLSGSIWSAYGEKEDVKSESSVVIEPTFTTTTDICTSFKHISETVETTYTTSLEPSTTATSSTTVTTTTVGPSEIYLGDFKGTYYRGSVNPCNGGSGRRLIDCAVGGMGVKGSVACRYVYEHYGYSYCGSRTVVRIEVPSHPEMNGMYYVDDCCASNSVVDFYYPDYSTCPFQFDGVISVKMWLVE